MGRRGCCLWRWARPTESDRDGVPGDTDALFAGDDRHRQPARPAHLDALDDLERGGRRDLAARTQVGTERRGGSPRRGVLDDATDRERIAGPEPRR